MTLKRKNANGTWDEINAGGGSPEWGNITGTLSNQIDLQTELSNLDSAIALKANSADVYTKTEVDTALDLKADKSQLYAVSCELTNTTCTGVYCYCVGALCILTFNDANIPNPASGGTRRFTVNLPAGLKTTSSQIRAALINGGSNTNKVWTASPNSTTIDIYSWSEGGASGGWCGCMAIPLVKA